MKSKPRFQITLRLSANVGLPEGVQDCCERGDENPSCAHVERAVEALLVCIPQSSRVYLDGEDAEPADVWIDVCDNDVEDVWVE